MIGEPSVDGGHQLLMIDEQRFLMRIADHRLHQASTIVDAAALAINVRFLTALGWNIAAHGRQLPLMLQRCGCMIQLWRHAKLPGDAGKEVAAFAREMEKNGHMGCGRGTRFLGGLAGAGARE